MKTAATLEIDITDMLREAMARQVTESAAQVEQTPPGERLEYWNTTPEEVARINGGDLEAVNAFFFRNELHIKYAVYAFFRHNPKYMKITEEYDLINQFYIDLATGVVKLRPWDRAIGRASRHSFRYAAIGGAGNYGGIYIPYEREEARKCQKRGN